jgi:hypothetical protein
MDVAAPAFVHGYTIAGVLDTGDLGRMGVRSKHFIPEKHPIFILPME